LKEICGEFQGCRLSAIVGKSGSGKTSLLNILAGYRVSGVTGSIKINDLDVSKYRNEIAYVMQESFMHESLTVSESIAFAIQLKTGNLLDSQQQQLRVSRTLQTFDLEKHHKTFVRHLSGGQRKRLSVALEIVDNPKIIFLDECTTGLDSSSAIKCVKILKQLANNGQTIICTIHQPSTLIMQFIDHIYAVSDGQCIYHGSFENLLPFMNELDLICPKSYNPIDYLMEVSHNAYGEKVNELVEKIENGKNENYVQGHDDKSIAIQDVEIKRMPSFFTQLKVLLHRNIVMILRDFTYTYFRIAAHLMLGILVGLLYGDIGNDASSIINNFRMVYGIIILTLFVSMYSQITYCELKKFILIKNI
jgi:ABC-type multidrug transport system ATPase subunit